MQWDGKVTRNQALYNQRVKTLRVILLTLILIFAASLRAHAQEAETIWIETSILAYEADEPISVSLYGISATPIQRFRFQISYDPACLRLETITSAIDGFNPLPQTPADGLVSATFASETPQTVAGLLAEIQFSALADCQTTLVLETAALETLDAAGNALPLEGIGLGGGLLDLTVRAPSGSAPPQPTAETSGMPGLEPIQAEPYPALTLGWPILLLVGLLGAGVIIVIIGLSREWRKPASQAELPREEVIPVLLVKRGAQAGQRFYIQRLPCRLGRGAENEIRLEDPHLAQRHAQIIAFQDGYGIMDLGSPEGTFVNGKAIGKQAAALQPGDVIHVGGVLLVFGN